MIQSAGGGAAPDAPAEGSGEGGADPSMEDILASIRRILNDDNETAGSPDDAPAATGAATVDDVFELDHSMIIEEPREPAIDPAPPAIAEQKPPLQASLDEAPLIAPATEAAASASLGALVRVLGQRQTQVYRGGPTLEDLVRDELRPLVKNWLDENLAPMVERMVRAEIERVTSRTL